MNTISTFDHRPSPNHSMRSGRNTSRGVALNAVMKGSNIALSVRERPISTPSGSPTTIARAKPTANPAALTPSGVQITPVANSRQSVPATWLGVVKKSLVPADIGTRRGRISQTSSSTTMLPVPSSTGSKRCQPRRADAACSPAGASSTFSVCDSLIVRSAKGMPHARPTGCPR